MELDRFTSEEYWTDRYRHDDIPWDAGSVTTPIKTYLDNLPEKNIRILVPGAGSAWEAEYARQAGFNEVYVIDISSEALERLRRRCDRFPAEHLIHGDFFMHEQQYDLIIEQTFFCALPPYLRNSYVNKMYDLLVPGGRLAGVLFDDPLNASHPPFGGNEALYRSLFFPPFEEKIMERCYNSIPPRAGRELFIELIRPE